MYINIRLEILKKKVVVGGNLIFSTHLEAGKIGRSVFYLLQRETAHLGGEVKDVAGNVYNYRQYIYRQTIQTV